MVIATIQIRKLKNRNKLEDMNGQVSQYLNLFMTLCSESSFSLFFKSHYLGTLCKEDIYHFECKHFFRVRTRLDERRLYQPVFKAKTHPFLFQ